MAYTYDELKGKTVAELREIAKNVDNEAVKGYSQLNKEHLLAALCKALKVDTHGHHKAKVNIDKMNLKLKIKELKKARDEAIAAKDHTKLERVRRQIHNVKHELRKVFG